jgi:hypothetical protein
MLSLREAGVGDLEKSLLGVSGFSLAPSSLWERYPVSVKMERAQKLVFPAPAEESHVEIHVRLSRRRFRDSRCLADGTPGASDQVAELDRRSRQVWT